jgi:hypothetical protein
MYALDEEHVFIGGTFTTVNGNSANQITMWNGITQTFNALFGGALNNLLRDSLQITTIYALDLSHVFIGGNFLTIGSTTYNGLVMWDGTTQTLTPLLSGVLDQNSSPLPRVYSIYALDLEHVYIGGNFTKVNGSNGSRITMWNGITNSFTQFASAPGGAVNAIYALDLSHVYIGGSFSTAGGNTNNKNITMWNGTTFTPLLTGVSHQVNAIYALDLSHVYIGGNFTSANNNTNIKYITMWNGTTFTQLGNGVGPSAKVNTIYALDLEHIYIGGEFVTVNDISVNCVTVWNETTQTFTQLGGGINTGETYTRVYEIYALDAEHIYIGGNFRNAANSTGNITVNHITMWSG